MNPALAREAEPGTEPAPAWLWARDVARLLAAQAGQPPETATTANITQYLWLRGKHIRDEGQARPGDIPEPDDRGRPPWRVSGALYPRWRADGPIGEWVRQRQPPGRPRNDEAPRRRRKEHYLTPGPRPARG